MLEANANTQREREREKELNEKRNRKQEIKFVAVRLINKEMTEMT